MKITAGTTKLKEAKAASFTKETSGQPKKKKNELKIPKSVTDNPGKHRLQHTVRPIHNGFIVNTTYDHPDHGYVSHEVYHSDNPMGEGAGEESKDTFGHVEGLK